MQRLEVPAAQLQTDRQTDFSPQHAGHVGPGACMTDRQLPDPKPEPLTDPKPETPTDPKQETRADLKPETGTDPEQKP
jgi:hypothetical protein